MGKNKSSPSTEDHANGRPTNKWARPGSARGSLKTLLSPLQCHAALSSMHYTMAWIDQTLVSRLVPYNPHHGTPSTTFTAFHVTHSRVEQRFSTTGPRPGTGTWHQLYRAARGSLWIFHFNFLTIFVNKCFIGKIFWGE